MLEVVFDSSAKIGMKIEGKDKSIDGCFENIVYIGFYFDMGDISGKIDGMERQEVFQNIWGHVNFDKNEMEEFFNMQRDDMRKLLTAAKQGVPIRIWKSNAPFSACAFSFVCDVLRNIDCKISVVSLPKHIAMPNNTIVSYSSWGAIASGQFYSFLTYEKELSTMEKIMQADLWQDLRQENSPLRAIVNGQLISVPEDFYDHIIINNIPEGEFIMARLIGEILGKYELGISDSWYALRIHKMIEENILKVVRDNSISHPYEKILKKIAM